MNTLYILDTNILVHYVRDGKVWSRIQASYNLLLTQPTPGISVVTIGELKSLALQFQWQAAKRDRLDFIVDYFKPYALDDDAIIDTYALIDSQMKRQGIPMGKNDLWIAATTSFLGATLLTTDRDFDCLTPLYIQRDWIDPTIP